MMDVRRLNGHPELLGAETRAHKTQPGQNKQKLLAAVAAHPVVGAHCALKDCADLLEHVVAGQVAVGVVDVLEVIQIRQNNAQRHAVAARAVHLLVQPFNHDAVIPQAGQIVVFRILPHLLFGPQQFGLLALQVLGPALNRHLKLSLLFNQVMDAPLPHQHHNDAHQQYRGQPQRSALPPTRSDAKCNFADRGDLPAHSVQRFGLKAVRTGIESRVPYDLVPRFHPFRFEAQKAIADVDVARIPEADRVH